MEPLTAYTKAHLELNGNSTSLAKWDAKLGFHSTPFIATLRSLSNDGGPVPLMDIVITKTFPIGYIETRDDGERPTPICEAEERDALEKWRVRQSYQM
jgi:breast cancer 2 susceptibility protein